jgi:hypothetical protein
MRPVEWYNKIGCIPRLSGVMAVQILPRRLNMEKFSDFLKIEDRSQKKLLHIFL